MRFTGQLTHQNVGNPLVNLALVDHLPFGLDASCDDSSRKLACTEVCRAPYGNREIDRSQSEAA